jgi:DNA-binding MarR family transcriptional regulator
MLVFRRIYALIQAYHWLMTTPNNKLKTRLVTCNCLALRQAARHVTQFYDQVLVPSGLRTTQFSVLATLHHLGPMTINNLAKDLVLDRTTLGRNILPLQRDGLIAAVRGSTDHRSKELHLTEAGEVRLRSATKLWARAQRRFEAVFGAPRAAALRVTLGDISVTDLA